MCERITSPLRSIAMIYVDENEPIGDLKSEFDHRQVVIKRNRDVRTEYEMLHEIGRGKFGRVMKCRDFDTPDKYYAAKFVHTTRRDDRRNVEREVEIMNSLKHPKLLQLFDAYDNGRNEMCILTEYIGGGELFDRVIEDEFVLTEKACIAFMKQILQGIEYIHSQQIVHLDLKPENILCHTKTGNRIKIIDFGLARRYEPMKKLQVLFGTPEFVAPEVVNFEPIGYATDMWAVGVICYVLLSGLSPFMGDTDLETMANVTIAEYDYDDEVFDNVSDYAKDFIDKLLMKEKGKRYSCKSCLQHPWLNNFNNSKELLFAKENISTFQKDPSKKSNYYLFDHSNHTITPTEDSLILADVNRKRSLLENCKENEIKRCKTPTREDSLIQPKKEQSNCCIELWQATERTVTPCWEDLSSVKPLAINSSKEDDTKTEVSWEPDHGAESILENVSEIPPSRTQSLEEEENKENNLPLHSETLINANEIEDIKLATATSESKNSQLSSSSSTGITSPSPPSSQVSSSSPLMSSSSSMDATTSGFRSGTSSCSSSPSDCNKLTHSKRAESSENIFAEIKDIIRNCPEPKSRVDDNDKIRVKDRLKEDPIFPPSPNPKLDLSPTLPNPSSTESFDNSIAELSNKLNGSYLLGGKHNVDGHHSSKRSQSSRQYFEFDILSKESLRKSSFHRCRDKIPVYLDIKSSQR
ncbi:uncharacterized protein [Lepeophtheirus salmonis]|nr:calcium/calmodulin-dependent protein kinase type IV-like isoform X4 [Lepeophtheirus salmonis]